MHPPYVKLYVSKSLEHRPMYSPFSRDKSGQNDAWILCILGANLREQRNVR